MAEATVLVTGATGFLGRRIVSHLLARDFTINALVRATSNTEDLRLPGVRFFEGDITDARSLAPAFAGADYVIHAAAGTAGTDEQMRRVTVEGARNILDHAKEHPIRKLVYISSCSVYGVGEYADHQIVREDSPLERHPLLRGSYSASKLEAECLVSNAVRAHGVPVVILRPGTIYGERGENFTPMLGFKRGRYFFVIARKGFILPLVYLENLVEAVVLAMLHQASAGRTYNVVDPYHVDKKQYMNQLIRRLYPGARCVYVPYTFLASLVAAQEKLFGIAGRDAPMTMYRLLSSQRPVIYSADRIMKELAWQPRHTFAEAVQRIGPTKHN